MQQFAFALGEFATQEDFLLGVADAAHVGKCVRIHQVVPAELVVFREESFGLASRTELVPRPLYFQGMDKAGDGDELFFEK